MRNLFVVDGCAYAIRSHLKPLISFPTNILIYFGATLRNQEDSIFLQKEMCTFDFKIKHNEKLYSF